VNYPEFYELSEKYQPKPIEEILNLFKTDEEIAEERLEEKLQKAISEENYERAAILRDQMIRVKTQKTD
jgi:protein-arginine kinase activator protein McsA